MQSTWRQIGAVLELVEEFALAKRPQAQLFDRPFRVLDVGCGWGHYGVLIADQWPWARVWGIDARPEDVKWIDAYDRLAWGVLPGDIHAWPESVDLVLLLDVIEHLDKPDGIKALAWCRRHGPTILATPNGFMEQDGDEFDRHRSGWTAGELEALGAQRLTVVPPHPATNGGGQIVCLFPQEGQCPS